MRFSWGRFFGSTPLYRRGAGLERDCESRQTPSKNEWRARNRSAAATIMQIERGGGSEGAFARRVETASPREFQRGGESHRRVLERALVELQTRKLPEFR